MYNIAFAYLTFYSDSQVCIMICGDSLYAYHGLILFVFQFVSFSIMYTLTRNTSATLYEKTCTRPTENFISLVCT